MAVDLSITEGCKHERKGLRRASTTDWPPAAIMCLDCCQELVTIEDAKIFVAAADGGFVVQTIGGAPADRTPPAAPARAPWGGGVMPDAEFDFLRPATHEEYALMCNHNRGGVYSGCTDVEGTYGYPSMMTTWCDKSNSFPSCRIEERADDYASSLHDARERGHVRVRYWINPDLMPRGV